MVDAEIKGITLKSRVEFITKHYGKQNVEKIFRMLEPKWGNLLSNKVLATKWYSLRVQDELDDLIKAHLADGDERIYQRMGAYSADIQFTEKYAGFVRTADPHNILRKSTVAYDRFFRPGKAEYQMLGPTEGRITISLFKSSPNNCQTNIGFYKRAVELSGGKDVKVREEGCTGKGDPACKFVLSWK